MNEAIVEIVMRSGVEHRNGIPFDRLWDLARAELKKRNDKPHPPSSIEEWKAMGPIHYALCVINEKLQMIAIQNTDAVQIVRWRGKFPEVKL